LAIYKTVLIIFPLNLQTITITLDVVKWRLGGGERERRKGKEGNERDHPPFHPDPPLYIIINRVKCTNFTPSSIWNNMYGHIKQTVFNENNEGTVSHFIIGW